MIMSVHVIPDVLGFRDVLVVIRLPGVRAADLQIALASRFRIYGKRRQQSFELRASTRRADDGICVLGSHELFEEVFT